MMKRVIFTNVDGGLTVLNFAPEMFAPKSATRGALANEDSLALDATEAEVFAWCKAKMVPADAIDVQEVDAAKIPTDRTYRNAWKTDGAGGVGHDMPKARDIHRDKMRDARKPKLAALDVEYQRADEAGNAATKSQVATSKQALRDVTATPEIEAAQTVDELAAVWPAMLV